MIPCAPHFRLNPASLIFVSLIFLATARHASAQTFLGPLQSCGLRKAYAVIIKLLAVYASHILTIKVEPGLGRSDTILRYVMAALLPSSSAQIPLTDLIYSTLLSRGEVGPIHKQMQKAINCGAACVRVRSHDMPPGAIILSPTRVVRAKPLRQGNGEDEAFIMVPRGTPANLFVPMMIQSSSAAIKVLVGTFQLIFATLQLLSVSDPQVAAYGYGAFTYTIIPYALGSIINLIAILFTGSYVDLTEVEIDGGDSGTANAIQWRGDGTEYAIRWRHVGDQQSWMLVGICEFAVYLAIVGGVTRFSSGISSRAQRGWFLSWALCGTIYGYIFNPQPSKEIADRGKELVADIFKAVNLITRTPSSQHQLPTPITGTLATIIQILYALPAWVPTVGGVVAMIQQYLHLIQC
ncbi:hypothetical protein JB92DRAFT_3098970 [Gautieria morchelliformis]|nr:hypothetical protein JB92DRAFT_3098970 [Gautieria morchelliformis]